MCLYTCIRKCFRTSPSVSALGHAQVHSAVPGSSSSPPAPSPGSSLGPCSSRENPGTPRVICLLSRRGPGCAHSCVSIVSLSPAGCDELTATANGHRVRSARLPSFPVMWSAPCPTPLPGGSMRCRTFSCHSLRPVLGSPGVLSAFFYWRTWRFALCREVPQVLTDTARTRGTSHRPKRPLCFTPPSANRRLFYRVCRLHCPERSLKRGPRSPCSAAGRALPAPALRGMTLSVTCGAGSRHPCAGFCVDVCSGRLGKLSGARTPGRSGGRVSFTWSCLAAPRGPAPNLAAPRCRLPSPSSRLVMSPPLPVFPSPILVACRVRSLSF